MGYASYFIGAMSFANILIAWVHGRADVSYHVLPEWTEDCQVFMLFHVAGKYIHYKVRETIVIASRSCLQRKCIRQRQRRSTQYPCGFKSISFHTIFYLKVVSFFVFAFFFFYAVCRYKNT